MADSEKKEQEPISSELLQSQSREHFLQRPDQSSTSFSCSSSLPPPNHTHTIHNANW